MLRENIVNSLPVHIQKPLRFIWLVQKSHPLERGQTQGQHNITHNNTAVSAEELGMVAADGRTKANHNFKCRAMGAVTAQLHGSFVARTIPEWNRLPAAAADAVSPTLFHSRLNAMLTSGRVVCRRRRLHLSFA